MGVALVLILDILLGSQSLSPWSSRNPDSRHFVFRDLLIVPLSETDCFHLLTILDLWHMRLRLVSPVPGSGTGVRTFD